MQIIYDLIASSWFLNAVTLLFCMAIVGAYVFYRKDLITLNKKFLDLFPLSNSNGEPMMSPKIAPYIMCTSFC